MTKKCVEYTFFSFKYFNLQLVESKMQKPQMQGADRDTQFYLIQFSFAQSNSNATDLRFNLPQCGLIQPNPVQFIQLGSLWFYSTGPNSVSFHYLLLSTYCRLGCAGKCRCRAVSTLRELEAASVGQFGGCLIEDGATGLSKPVQLEG